MSFKNHGSIVGRTTRALSIEADEKGRKANVMKNKDGSFTALLTVAVDEDFLNRDGSRKTNFLNFEVYLPADKVGLFAYVTEGVLVGFDYRLVSDSYEKNGETVFTQKAVIDRTSFELLESKEQVAARQASKAAGSFGQAKA